LARDYELFKNRPNMTFIAICSTPGADMKAMQNEEATLKIKDLPFAKMLDANGATLAGYHMTPDIPYQLVVLDHEGNIAFNGNSMMSYSTNGGPAIPLRVSSAEKILKSAPGMLPDVKVPESMATALHLYNLQQFDKLDAELAKARKADTSAEAQQFAQMLETKVTEYRARRLEELTALTESNPVRAFREVEAFLQCFPRSKEATAAKALLTKLNSNSKVRLEKEAQTSFDQVVMSAMQRVRTRKQYDTNVAPLVQGYLKKYGETEFVKVAQDSTDAYVKTLR
jgi:hypothetical protein